MLKDFLHLLYPEVCIGCGSDSVTPGQCLCLECFASLPETGFFQHANNPMETKFFGRAKIRHAGSAYYYEKDTVIQRLLQEVKYKENRQCGLFMGHLMVNTLVPCTWMAEIDILVPIPLSKKRKEFRGYNQSAILAQPIAEYFSLPLNDNAVIRTVHTETQTHKNREERWNSMQNIFKITDMNALQNKHVLVIDDVFTTGATTEVLCNVLLKETNARVSVATFSCAV